MDSILAVEEDVNPQDLEKFKREFLKEQESGKPSSETQFAYAWCLVRTRNSSHLQLGKQLLEDLYHRTSDELAKRDYLYYISVACCRLKDYRQGLKFVNAILMAEPNNRQAQQLQKYIDKQLKKDGLIGMAVVGGAAALAVGSIVGLGIALSKK